MLGVYRLGDALGKGATGIVYEGTDLTSGRMVAIKTLALTQRLDLDSLAEAKIRFFHEAGAAQRLSHPDIVKVYAAGEDHEIAYIAMELLKGKDLTRYTNKGERLPLASLLSIFARVADALAYAHAQGVVHGDIKPANIVWEPETDNVKISDFGMAQMGEFLSEGFGMLHGTPSYMSPEQLAGEGVDGRSDLFSLGVSLYQLACGELPFRGESIGQLRYRISREPHPDIRLYRPDLPACVAAIIDRALAKDPVERYQDGTQMAHDARSCLMDSCLSAGSRRDCAVPAD